MVSLVEKDLLSVNGYLLKIQKEFFKLLVKKLGWLSRLGIN